MINQVEKNAPKRMKAESSYNPIALGEILETEMGDMTRAAFARKLGITRPSLDKYLSAVKGGIAPSCEALCLMADNLGCSVDYLLGRTAARVPEKAVAVDELGLTEKVVSSLMEQKQTAGYAYHLFAVLLTMPWFWDVMQAAQSLVKLKAEADMGTEDSPFPRGFDIKHIDGHRVACYSGDSVRRSLVHYISENFAAGLDSLTDGLVDINESDNTCTVDYDKYLYNAKNAAPTEEPKR